MTNPSTATLEKALKNSATKAYIKEMLKSGLTLNIKGNNAALERLYGSQGPTAIVSALPHSPASALLQTREAVLNKLTKNQYRTDTKLESLARLLDTRGYNNKLLDAINKQVGYIKPNDKQLRLAHAAVAADTAASFIPLPLISDILRPSKYLESKALHGNSLYNLVPLYNAHKYLAKPRAEQELLKQLANNQELSMLDRALLNKFTNTTRK